MWFYYWPLYVRFAKDNTHSHHLQAKITQQSSSLKIKYNNNRLSACLLTYYSALWFYRSALMQNRSVNRYNTALHWTSYKSFYKAIWYSELATLLTPLLQRITVNTAGFTTRCWLFSGNAYSYFIHRRLTDDYICCISNLCSTNVSTNCDITIIQAI